MIINRLKMIIKNLFCFKQIFNFKFNNFKMIIYNKTKLFNKIIKIQKKIYNRFKIRQNKIKKYSSIKFRLSLK